MASRARITQSTVSLIETGARGCSVEVLQRLAEALELTVEERAELLAWAAAQAASRNAA